jgi:hypothetical protein
MSLRETIVSSEDAGEGESSYPETWLWDEHGDVCSGGFVRFDKAATREYGKKLILVLEVDGQERSVWLLQTALFERIRDELSDRPNRQLAPGEQVAIKRRAETKTKDGERSYRPFQVYFPDRPELDLAREFDLTGPKPGLVPVSEQKDSSDVDDDIPF